MSIEPH